MKLQPACPALRRGGVILCAAIGALLIAPCAPATAADGLPIWRYSVDISTTSVSESKFKEGEITPTLVCTPTTSRSVANYVSHGEGTIPALHRSDIAIFRGDQTHSYSSTPGSGDYPVNTYKNIDLAWFTGPGFLAPLAVPWKVAISGWRSGGYPETIRIAQGSSFTIPYHYKEEWHNDPESVGTCGQTDQVYEYSGSANFTALGPLVGRTTKRFTQEQKDLMDVYAKDLAIVATGSTVIGVGAALVPEPVVSKGVAIFSLGVAATTGLTSAIFDRLAADPPDPNFEELARVKSPRVPGIRAKGRLTAILARRANALLKNEARAAGVAVALLKSVERAQGAEQAEDDEHDAQQMHAARGHAAELASLFRRSITLRRRFKNAWYAARLPKVKLSVASIARAKKKLAKSGGSFFAHYGADDDTALMTARFIARVPTEAGPASFPSILTERSLVRSTKKLIRGLRAFSEAGP